MIKLPLRHLEYFGYVFYLWEDNKKEEKVRKVLYLNSLYINPLQKKEIKMEKILRYTVDSEDVFEHIIKEDAFEYNHVVISVC